MDHRSTRRRARLAALLALASGVVYALSGCSGSGDGAGAAPDAATDGATSPMAADAGADGDNASDGEVLADGGAPSCTGPAPGVPFPNAPHGIFAFEQPPQWGYGEKGATASFDANNPPAYMLNAPTVCGAMVVVPWSSVDTGPDGPGPQYDFSTVEAAIAPWKAVGKRVNLLIQPAKVSSSGDANDLTPPYVLASVPSVACGGSNEPFPKIWDPVYIADYEAFIAAMLGKYGNDPEVGYLRFGLSAGAEATLNGCSGVEDAGLTVDVWEGYVSQIEAFVAKTPHTVTVAMPNAGYGGRAGDAGIDPVQQFEVTSNLTNGFGTGTESFAASDELPDGTCDPKIAHCHVFAAAYKKVPLYAQTSVYCTGGIPGPCDVSQIPDGVNNQGSLVSYLPFGSSLGIQSFELYTQNLQVAYDPTFPAYAAYGASYRAALEKEAAIVGHAP